MSLFPSLESYPLKRGKGAPDVYPQETNQREDSMSTEIVRDGFQWSKSVDQEYATSKDTLSQITNINIWNFFYEIMAKRKETNTCVDTNRSKKLTSNLKDSYIHAIDKNKDAIENWFKDLAGSVPLSKLAKRIPLLHKKEEMFQELYKHDVPITRAVWLIKMNVMQSTLIAENNKKKLRTNTDPSIEWANLICRLLNESMKKINHNSYPIDSSVSDGNVTPEREAFQQWKYYFRIMMFMYDEDLLDHWEILLFFVTSLEKLSEDHGDLDSMLKFFLPYIIEIGPRFSESEIITRRLLYWTCNTFSEIILDDPQVRPYVDSPAAFQSLMENYLELNSCPLHRIVVLCLSGLIMGLSQQCPCAVVWNDVQCESYLQGSPLDVLPCSLATLPAPPGPESIQLRECLKYLEISVIERSTMAEKLWYKRSNSINDENIRNLLKVLETLDSHDYNRVSEDNNMDTLFQRVFGSERDLSRDCQLVMFLSEWVTSQTRTGIHRPVVAATLMEMLVKHYDFQAEHFQSTLVKFLDSKAPIVDSNISVDSEPFINLVALFGELNDCQIFDHDFYVRTFIARGVFESGSQPLSVLRNNQQTTKSDLIDDANFENPDSVRSESSCFIGNADYKRLKRHVQYLLHFPLPQDESYANEQNQRFQLLYGIGRARDPAKSVIKKLVRDISRLFTKKMYLIDIAHGEYGKRKKKELQREEMSKIEKIHEGITRRFKDISYYEMECVISQSIVTLEEIMRGRNSALSKVSGTDIVYHFLPLNSTLNFFFDLIETSLNYTCLLQTVTNIFSYHQQFMEPHFKTKPHWLATYQSILCLNVIGILRKYQAVLMTMPEVKRKAFNSLIHMVRSVGNPTQCTSTERCILAYLHDLFQASSLIQQWFCNLYGRASNKVSTALLRQVEPAKGRSEWKENFAKESIISVAKGMHNVTIDDDLKKNTELCYSFVCNVLLFIFQASSMAQIVNVCIFSAEMTAKCSSLPPEWLGALYTVLCPKSNASGYTDLIKQIDISDTNKYDGLSMLVGTLLARQCFTITAFLKHVICPAMAQGLDQSTTPVDPSLEPIIRSACHILHRLFTVEYPGGFGYVMTLGSVSFKLPEPLLLTGMLQKVSTEFIVDILKMLIVHGDKANTQLKKKRDFIENLYDTMGSTTVEEKLESVDVKVMKLGDFTQRVLREICNVPWVREKFSKESASRLIRENVLIDKNISDCQARQLLNIICRPSETHWIDIGSDVSSAMTRLLRNLDLWTLRFSNMELQLHLTQIPHNQQADVLERVAKAIVDNFQVEAQNHVPLSIGPGIPEVHLQDDNSAWLVPPLISRLPEALMTQIIKAASEKLDAKHFWSHKNDQEKERNLLQSSVVLAHPPFVTLLLDCLQTEDQKDELLKSLRVQIEYFVQNAKETEDKVPDDLRIRKILQWCLQVRLGLVGNLFDRIQTETDYNTEWCILLSQLIIYGVVELQSNRELFYTVLDMLTTLMHNLFEKGGGSDRKHYQSTAKKIRREIMDKMSDGIELLKPLLPIVKSTYDVIVVAPNKNDKNNKKLGYTVQKKERLNPWEVIDGIKNVFSLSWFGAIRTELPVSRIEQQTNLLMSHEHYAKFTKPDSYFVDLPQLPVEELLPDPNQMEEPSTPQTAMISTPSPSATVKKECEIKTEAIRGGGNSNPPSNGSKRKSRTHSNIRSKVRNTASPANIAVRPPSASGLYQTVAPNSASLVSVPQSTQQDYFNTMMPSMQPPHPIPSANTSNPNWVRQNPQFPPYQQASMPPASSQPRIPLTSQRQRPQPNIPNMHIRQQLQSRLGTRHLENSSMYTSQMPQQHTISQMPNPPPYHSNQSQPLEDHQQVGNYSQYQMSRRYQNNGEQMNFGMPQQNNQVNNPSFMMSQRQQQQQLQQQQHHVSSNMYSFNNF